MARGLAIASVALCLGACARRGVAEERPFATLSSAKPAKDEFRPLQRDWLAGDLAERVALSPRLLAFRERHPQDELARLATVYLAWNAIEHSELSRARELVSTVLDGPPGTTRELAVVAEAAILRREGDAAGALARLSPLVGKVIEPHARALFSAELVRAAIDASRFYEAVGYMDVWLQHADGEDRSAARQEVERSMELIPLEVVRAIAKAPAESGYSHELRRLLTSRLAELAGDSELGFRDPAHVDGRTVGLLLSLDSPSSRARGAEVLTGALDVLGPSRNGDGSVKLITADDAGDPAKTEAALAELASRGAAMIIAGVDPAQSVAAMRYAATTSMPILLLVIPKESTARPASVFVVGGAEDELGAELSERFSARDVSAWLDRHGAPPSFLSALARDAAVIAEAASMQLPTTKADQPGDVAWRYVETQAALEKVNRELWTTEARGFGKERAVPREARITEIP